MGADSWWHLATMVALLLAVAEGVLLLGLARAVAPLLAARGRAQPAEWGIAVGMNVPALLLPARRNGTPEPVVREGRDQIVLFVTPSCSGCAVVAPTVRPMIEQGGQCWEVVVLVCGAQERAEEFAERRIDRRVRVLFDPNGAAEAAFQTNHAYPLGFAVSREGIVRARGLAGRWEVVRQLAADAVPAERRVLQSEAGNGAATGSSVVAEG